MSKSISLIGYPFGEGAQIHDCEKGPETLRKWNLADKLQQKNINAHWAKNIKPSLTENNLQNVENACQNLYQQVQQATRVEDFPITIGGDHSMAIGTWSAISEQYNIKRKLGLLWIDAHLDANTPDTSPSGAIHGMPAAHLIGFGNKELINLGSIGAKINPQHLVYIGIRSFEEEEYNLLDGLGAHIFTMDDIKQQGMDKIMVEAMEIITANTDGFGVTIDLDAFDPTRAPGVGSPEESGLLRNEVFSALNNIGNHKNIKAIEIAEYNPNEGSDDLTKNLVFDLITAIFGK